VSTAIASSYGLSTDEDLAEALALDSGALRSIIYALVGRVVKIDDYPPHLARLMRDDGGKNENIG